MKKEIIELTSRNLSLNEAIVEMKKEHESDRKHSKLKVKTDLLCPLNYVFILCYWTFPYLVCCNGEKYRQHYRCVVIVVAEIKTSTYISHEIKIQRGNND